MNAIKANMEGLLHTVSALLNALSVIGLLSLNTVDIWGQMIAYHWRGVLSCAL